MSSYNCNNRFYFAMFDCFIKAIATSPHQPAIAHSFHKPTIATHLKSNSDRLFSQTH
ncbi:hypothetical protein [Pseudanabaena sp. UWO311]|uniref:hypothetical protein n=1 Tax=Pseudanabaena sp. UWO311 TaxID=2487337 RepID=UPI00168169AD|nr:hypothetical protein [Pseudanabaena sp. UWO311]